MTCLAAEPRTTLAPQDPWALIRAVVFWGFILLVIVSPAVLSAMILMRI